MMRDVYWVRLEEGGNSKMSSDVRTREENKEEQFGAISYVCPFLFILFYLIHFNLI